MHDFYPTNLTHQLHDQAFWLPVVIHPASRGGPPAPQVFWFSPCKDIEHASKVFVQCFLIVFLQRPRNLYIFGHKVGPKHRFLQCCFNLFFKNNIIYAFFCWSKTLVFAVCSIPLKTSVFKFFFIVVRFSVAGSLPSPFFGCRSPPKTTQNSISIPSSDPTPKNRPKNYENTSGGRVSVRKF